MTSSPRPTTLLLVVSLLITWLVWGSSFAAIDLALNAMPPLLLMATRFIVAGSIAALLGLLLARRATQPMPSLSAWRDAAVVGVGLVTVGMGATGWASTRLSTGVTALLVAAAPLWIALLQLTVVRGGSRSRLGAVGLLVGIAGVATIVVPTGGSASIDPVAAGVLVLANLGWASASLYSTRATRPSGLLLGTGMQMLTGGAALLVVALATGEARQLQLEDMTAIAIGGWLWLVIAASIGGFVAYGWLLANVSASTASTHAFVNPLVAVAIGAALLGEHVGLRMAIAGAAVTLAVVLLLVAEARSRTPTAVAPRRDRAPGRQHAGAARPARRRAAGGWSPAPTPAFAARRVARPWQATDGMDALAIDEAFDRLS